MQYKRRFTGELNVNVVAMMIKCERRCNDD